MGSEPFLPYGRHCVDEDAISAVAEVLRSDWLTTGPRLVEFEAALAERCGARFAVGVNSGTAALHAAYAAAGLGPGDEILTSPLTFAATANAALLRGATVGFVDVDPSTGNLELVGLEAAITDRTRLIVPVDYAGQPNDYDSINAIARRYGLTVVADAAHSYGGSHRGRPVGVLADVTAVSFHPVKPLTTAEGGAVLTNDAGLAESARSFRHHGIVRRPDDDEPWWYEMHELGLNYRLSELHAALGLCQIRQLAGFLERRRSIAKRYSEAFVGLEAISLPAVVPGTRSGWHLYVIRLNDPSRRAAVFRALRAEGIGVQVHYIPVYWHPYYAELGYERGLCPNAEEFYARAISLPIFPAMTDEQVDRVIEIVRKLVG